MSITGDNTEKPLYTGTGHLFSHQFMHLLYLKNRGKIAYWEIQSFHKHHRDMKIKEKYKHYNAYYLWPLYIYLKKKIKGSIGWLFKNLVDKKIKMWRISKFIKNYTLILSIPFILFGFNFIHEVYDNQIDFNVISVYPGEATKGTIYENDTTFNFNPSISRVPIDYINIYIDYKEPVIRDDIFQINDIKISIFENYYNDVDSFVLELRGAKDSKIYFHNEAAINPNIFSYLKSSSEYFDISKEMDYYGNNLMILSPYIVDKSITFLEPDLNDHFYFSYKLTYLDEGKLVTISGNAILFKTIRCANDVEVSNIQINKNLQLLTGVLIILGSFPFLLALKQLLQKDTPEEK